MSELALHRIREAKHKRLTSLDLGNCNLEILPIELFELTWLEELYLSSEGYFYDFDKKEPIHFKSKNNLKANCISHFGKFVSLLSPFKSLKPTWENFVSLKILLLKGNKERAEYEFRDIEPLKYLINLQQLDISDTYVRNLKPLQYLDNLRLLNISWTQVKDLTPLKGLKNLERLYAENIPLSKFDWLTQKIEEKMTLEKLKETVHGFISKAKTKEAMDAIAIWAHENSQKQLKDDINLLKGELVTLDRQETLGLLSFSDVAREKAKLNHRLLNLLNGIDKTNDKVEEGTEETVPKKVTKKKAVAKPTAKKILFLGANPFDTGKLNLKEEYAGIAKQLEDKGAKERLVLKSEFCTDLEGFQEKTNTFRPNILHFAGHGSDANGELEAFGRGIGRPDWKENIGLIFHKSGYGGAMLINDATLDYNFQTFIEDDKIPIEVLVLNACYSTNQAEVLSKRVKYVVGVHNSIDDNASIDFSAGFYYGLSDGKTIESAFRYGKGRAMPKLKDKNQIVLFIEGVISNL